MRGLAEGSRYGGALGNHQQHDLQDMKVLGTAPGTEQCWTKAQPQEMSGWGAAQHKETQGCQQQP